MTKTIQGFRLSPQQKHLWLLQKDNSKAQAVIAIAGNLQPKLLKTALQKVIAKHEILRTSFRHLEGMKIPVMVVEDDRDIVWEEHDLCDRDIQEREIARLFEETNEIFSLIKLSIDKHILFVNLPALCADTRTLINLVKEIGKAYANENTTLSEETLQYIQFSEWQNQLLEDEGSETGKHYWQSQDFSAINNLNLPFDRKVEKFEPKNFSIAIASNTTAKLEQLTQNYNISLDILLLTCWQILLWKLTSKSEIIIGKTYDNREYEELQDALGLFSKHLPISCKLNDNLSLQELLEKAQAAIVEAEEWQDYFEQEIKFPIGFEFVKYSQGYLTNDIKFYLSKHFICIEPFKLKLTCIQKQDCLITEFDYNANCFNREEIQRIAGQFQILLTNLIENPAIVIADLELLNESDRQQILEEWNDTQTDFPTDKCIHQLFEERVRQNPNNIAIVCEEDRLTYEELNCKANQLARYLQSLGVGAETIVGIALERSLDTIVSILGILKAGGAYLVLDLSLPKEALAIRLQDTKLSVILTQQTFIEKLPEYNDRFVYLDKDREIIDKQKVTNPNDLVKSDNLVYVVFTSGSTGKPKGVAIEHRQLTNYLYGVLDKLALPTGASYATVSTFAADLGNTAIFPALCTGGCLHIISQQRTTDAEALADYFQRHAIDCLKIVPSHLAALIASGDAKAILPKQLLVLGGETANWDLIAQIQQQSSCRILNHYGPTETTVGVLTYPVEGRSIAATVTLGRPLANIRVYLLSDRLQPVPIGVPGELYIAGSGLARGYLNAPQLTQERFLDNPFRSGTKLYKTGDLARYLPDGNIEFLGRVDRQIKIRGFRIELEEIEAVLCQHPQVRQAVVIVRDEQRLVAYVVPKQTQNSLSEDLRHFLLEKLPEYMVPSAFVLLKALPLTANGKIDRDALPDRTELSNNFVPPSNPVEEVIAAIWAEVLNLKQVGIYDNFFALGGHSLLATQVISRLRKAFPVELSVRQLFEMPTVVELAKAIETGENLELPDIVRGKRDRELPLSFAQQRLWILNRLDPGSCAYNLANAIRLSGQLNVTALIDSINEIVRRHESLRTNFIDQQGKPFQKIGTPFKLSLPVIDLQDLPESARESEIRRLATQEARQGFDLAIDPLLRLTLLRLGEQEHVLLFTMHHIVSDGWSTGILVREVAALYEAFLTGKPSPLVELPVQYADFAIWQRNWLQGKVLERQLNYWKQQLSDAPASLTLPTDRPRPAMSSDRGAIQSFSLSLALTNALKALSQQEGVTLFMTLLAAFKVLLYRYSGQQDIVIGTPIANRNRSEIEGLIGFFVNTLVLRTNLQGNPSFGELLERIREVTLDAYAYQDLPFEQLVEEIKPERDLSHNSLFQVMFILQNAPMADLELPGLTLSALPVESHTASFDLTLSMSDGDRGLQGELEYNSDLFDATTIARMLEHFQTLLESIAADRDRNLSELSILTDSQRHQLLVEFNEVRIGSPLSSLGEGLGVRADITLGSIHTLFEERVKQTPDAIAVVCQEECLTYSQLNAKANQLAHYLRSLGVKPEGIVGLCVERSLALIIGIWGILKAGGAYLPLDPALPQQRLAFMLDDANISLLLTQNHLLTRFDECDRAIACLDSDWQLIASYPQDNPVNRTVETNLAYIIYTSGSTGIPKGVAIQHQSLLNYAEIAAAQYQLRSGDRVLQFASIGFDTSAEEIFPSLVRGSTLVLRTDEMLGSLAYFLEQCHQLQLTVLNLPTAFWHHIVSEQLEGQLALPTTLRLVIIGGEKAERKHLETWQQYAGKQVRLINTYGPTETTIVATMCDLSDADPALEVPIGRPIPQVQTYILDSYLQPVPIGIPGELYIGGMGLARGYLNQPELTAAAFIPNPFSQAIGSRLYKTGDLARYRPDGNIEFLGRIDNQVKIRGFRIELGEIEAILLEHPAVAEAVVLVREMRPGDRRLLAYLVPRRGETFSSNELRRYLQKRLPDYSIPATFILLDSLPLTVNGKLDRQALPLPNTARPEMEQAYTAPRTIVEEVLADIWSDILGLERVGIHDNFFELGGDSILSIGAIAKANQAGLQLTPKQLFEYQTIAELATVAGTTEAVNAEQGIVTGQVPLTPIQQWFFAQNLPNPHHWNQAILLEAIAPVDCDRLQEAIRHILSHHDALRLRFERTGSGWRQWIANPEEYDPVTRIDLSNSEQTFQTVATEIQSSLNLSSGAILRVVLFDFGSELPSRLLVVIHHLAIDGVSWRILYEDLQTAYQQLTQDKSIQLPAKTTSFKHWAECLQEYAQSEQLRHERDYWLANRSSATLPLDYPGGANTEASARTITITLDVESTRALLQDVPAVYRTQINDILLTALLQTFAEWTGNSTLLVDLEGHGREDIIGNIDLSRTVGWFTTIFPVLLHLEASDSPGNRLKSIKEQLRAIPQRGIGYGLLRYLSQDSSLAEMPQAEVSFNYLGQFDRVLQDSQSFAFVSDAEEAIGSLKSSQGKRHYLLSIDGGIANGQLQMTWTYSESLHQRATIERLAEGFCATLRSLVAHCQSPEAGGYTPSDFPLISLGQDELDRALAMVDFEE